jgi:signal recognition particle protein
MSVFENLSDRINHIFSKLRNKGKLTELEIKNAMREIRVALLEADVNYAVVKDFINIVSQKAVGEDILKSLTPVQQIIKIVNEELIALMSSNDQKLTFSSKPISVYMMCGLQGAGKTTMCGKLAKYLTKQNKKVLLVACDIYRPAAIEQLEIVGKKANVEVFQKGKIAPLKITKEALKYAEKNQFDVVILDTAGRLHIDADLMKELSEIKKAIDIQEILLTVDAMTGQDAVNVAKAFNDQLDITGVIITKLDGDTRGGAALSIKAISGKPIKLIGTGEKIEDLEPFHPDRMASRILGMGDVLTLIEKAQEAITEDEAKSLRQKMKDNSFTLDDYLKQLDSVKKMGGITNIIKLIPGLQRKLNGAMPNISEDEIKKTKAIIQSMTKKERKNPDIVKSNRKKRIANGSGTNIQDVNHLLKQFLASKEMMSKMANGKGLRGMMNPF